MAIDRGRWPNKAGSFVVEDLDEGVDYDAISPGPSFLDGGLGQDDERDILASSASYYSGRRRSSGVVGRAVQSVYGTATPPLSASGSSMSSSLWTGSYRTRLDSQPFLEPVMASAGPQIREYLEVWDYKGGAHFRGFTATVPTTSLSSSSAQPQKTMLVFLEHATQQLDLKPGLMALMELASTSQFDCQRLLVCLERDGSLTASAAASRSKAQAPDEGRLLRDLRWVGFEAATLDEFATPDSSSTVLSPTSERWLLLGTDV